MIGAVPHPKPALLRLATGRADVRSLGHERTKGTRGSLYAIDRSRQFMSSRPSFVS
jgi:hypothetical protein